MNTGALCWWRPLFLCQRWFLFAVVFTLSRIVTSFISEENRQRRGYGLIKRAPVKSGTRNRLLKRHRINGRPIACRCAPWVHSPSGRPIIRARVWHAGKYKSQVPSKKPLCPPPALDYCPRCVDWRSPGIPVLRSTHREFFPMTNVHCSTRRYCCAAQQWEAIRTNVPALVPRRQLRRR